MVAGSYGEVLDSYQGLLDQNDSFHCPKIRGNRVGLPLFPCQLFPRRKSIFCFLILTSKKSFNQIREESVDTEFGSYCQLLQN